MYCQNCGTKNEEDAVFCESCGTRLEKTRQVETPIFTAGTTPETVAAAPTKKLSKMAMVILAECVLIAVVVYGFYTLGQKSFSEERTATNFFVTMANGNWDKAYEKLDVKESTFINQEMFEMANRATSFGTIRTYAVKQDSKSLESLLNSSADLGTVVDINYRTVGSDSDGTYSVTLSEAPEKRYLLFDNWKVSGDPYIGEFYVIGVSDGASVSLDGITVGDEYLYTGEDYGYEDDYMTYYMIPQIFVGYHELAITQEGMEDVKATVYVSGDYEQYVASGMQMTKDTAEQLIQLASDNAKTIYTALMAGKSFQTVQDLFSTQAAEQVEEEYNDLLAYLNENSNTIEKLKIKDIEGSGSTDSTDVYLGFNYELTYTGEDWWSGEEVTDTYDGSNSIYMYFTKEEGKWVQTNLGVTSLYY